MGTEYILVNQTKKELISFTHLNGAKKRELAGNDAQPAMVTWYLLSNQGDQIQFISDHDNYWPFATGSQEELCQFSDKTDSLVDELIKQGILRDHGYLYQDENNPDTEYIRDIRRSW
ncbi:hypothetical protein CHH28_07325 [Bacterioplanes sanyensis]|uniref:Uncharacterized protein n=2 Tax=Bacterioplanes sanyensis TaxID=1249553 RepID=A0A222FHG0_9GAMM|nr:hypothetical protein CHH28_07325 [Bacterioplanes sanyensis]